MTAWEWGDSFRLHEAACLIAGVPVIPKPSPSISELPSEARRVFSSLFFAWVMWRKFHDAADDPKYPKTQMLRGLEGDGSESALELRVSREELYRWIAAMGRPSAYRFLQVEAGGAARFEGEKASKPVPQPSVDSDLRSPQCVSPATANWKTQVQIEATELVLRLRQSGASPTRKSISESMAHWCRENSVKTDGKIFPTATYLRTHVLGGAHWDMPN